MIRAVLQSAISITLATAQMGAWQADPGETKTAMENQPAPAGFSEDAARLRQFLEQVSVAWPGYTTRSLPVKSHETWSGNPVAKMLSSPDPATRRAGVEQLRGADSASAADACLYAMVDEDESVRAAAERTVLTMNAASVCERVLVTLCTGTPEGVQAVAGLLPKLKPLIEEEMLRVLETARMGSDKQKAAAYSLGAMKTRKAADRLADLAWSEDAELAGFATGALSTLEDPSSAEHLTALLGHPRESIRYQAARGLVQTGGPAAMQAFCGMLTTGDEPSPGIRVEAVRFLGRHGTKTGVAALIEGMSRYPDLRQAAAQALRNITGLDLGPDPRAWARWYHDTQSPQSGMDEQAEPVEPPVLELPQELQAAPQP